VYIEWQFCRIERLERERRRIYLRRVIDDELYAIDLAIFVRGRNHRSAADRDRTLAISYFVEPRDRHYTTSAKGAVSNS